MKRCQRCKRNYPDSENFCTVCGRKLISVKPEPPKELISLKLKEKQLEAALNKMFKLINQNSETIKHIKTMPVEDTVSLISSVGELESDLEDLSESVSELRQAKLPEDIVDIAKHEKAIAGMKAGMASLKAELRSADNALLDKTKSHIARLGQDMTRRLGALSRSLETGMAKMNRALDARVSSLGANVSKSLSAAEKSSDAKLAAMDKSLAGKHALLKSDTAKKISAVRADARSMRAQISSELAGLKKGIKSLDVAQAELKASMAASMGAADKRADLKMVSLDKATTKKLIMFQKAIEKEVRFLKDTIKNMEVRADSRMASMEGSIKTLTGIQEKLELDKIIPSDLIAKHINQKMTIKQDSLRREVVRDVLQEIRKSLLV